MDFAGFRRYILAEHSGRPQEVVRLTQVLNELESAIGALSRFGHHYHLAAGLGPQVDDYPRKLFHIHQPLGREVRDEFEHWELGVGWYDTLEEAWHASGMEHQMRGRGGRQRPGLPMVIEPRKTEEEIFRSRQAESKAKRADWMAQRAPQAQRSE